MSFLFEAIAWALSFLYSVYNSYGFAIIGLTVVVMLVLTPLTLKGTKSMMVMQQLQPEIKKLQSKFKDDRQKLNEELLKFYQENNINPLGGCLPLIVQMPIFIVLYQVLRGLTQRLPTTGHNIGWIAGQIGSHTSLTKPPTILTNFDPNYVDHTSALFQNLSSTTTMDFVGMDLAKSASDALGRGLAQALPYLVLIVIVGITGFVQQRQIQGRNPSAQINSQQQQIMKFLPIFLPLISFSLPAGLVVYFAVSNTYRVGQQAFISRSIYGLKRGEKAGSAAGGDDGPSKGNDDDGPSKGGASSGPSRGKGGGAGRGPQSSGKNGRGGSAKAAALTTKATKPEKSDKTRTSASSPATKAPAEKKPAPARPRGASGNSTTAPTLQPRARKNKKR